MRFTFCLNAWFCSFLCLGSWSSTAAQRVGKPVPPPPSPTPQVNAQAAQVKPSTWMSPGKAIKVTYPRSETKVHQESDPAKPTETWVRWDPQSVPTGSGVAIELWRGSALICTLTPEGWGTQTTGNGV